MTPTGGTTRLRGLLLAWCLLLGGSCAPAPPPGAEWPQFLGPHRDGTSESQILERWGAEGPRTLWRRPVGAGFAAPSVADGRLVLFHRVDDEEVVEALDPATGESLWRTGYPTDFVEDLFGFDAGPRAAPTVADGVVYTCGAERVVQALDLETGQRLWLVDGIERYRTRKGPFGAACPPLVWNGRVMVNLGGRDGAGIVAMDVASGETVWTATDHEASHAAGVMAEIHGQQRALFFTRFGLVDLDPTDGSLRAEFPWRTRSRTSSNAASPVVIQDRVFLSASYGIGAVLLDVTDDGFEPLWSDDETLSNHYVTSVYNEGTLYGIHGRQPLNPSLRAVEPVSGAVLWVERQFGTASLLVADDTLVLLHENGDLILADADPREYRVRARARVLEPEVRAYPALAGGILYVRDETELVALDLRE